MILNEEKLTVPQRGLRKDLEALRAAAQDLAEGGDNINNFKTKLETAITNGADKSKAYPRDPKINQAVGILGRIKTDTEKYEQQKEAPNPKEQGAVQQPNPVALADEVREKLASAGISVSGGTEQSGYLNVPGGGGTGRRIG